MDVFEVSRLTRAASTPKSHTLLLGGVLENDVAIAGAICNEKREREEDKRRERQASSKLSNL